MNESIQDFDPTSATVDTGIGIAPLTLTEQTIANVSRIIEGYLNKAVIIRKYTDEFVPEDWTYNVGLAKYQAWPGRWPLIESDTTGVTISTDKTRLLYSSFLYEVISYSGYRRSDQNLAALQVQWPLLAATPDIVPADIQRVAFKLTMYELNKARQNTFGTRSRIINTGSQSATVDAEDTGFYDRELATISVHRRLI